MDANLMHDYINRVVKPYFKERRGLLVLDECTAHYTLAVKKHCLESNVVLEFIPGGYTNALQPCDIGMNAPIKGNYRKCWNEFMTSEAEYNTGGNRKKPGYEVVTNWVSQCIGSIELDSIQKSFTTCGLFKIGQVKIFNEEPYLSSTGAKISLNGDFKIDNSNIETVADTLNIQSNLTNQIRRFTRRVKKFKV